ncbi:RNA-binding protein involved in meiosis Mei2 [Sugiyamaella lignohabitans]|uniref:RNA-binding protein involved in meiosis Mei2 n=1 Tax=Sugiyamaella lignohabitans TaxID=796027 RepID=A0A167C4S4_9ASCO|nr:RNA-binding protein involved in meiosis Mei2 [Sugiyamaella lignohabitans]ANB11214.1 RNA-binding protein involved in meiosis Mei2 [Sugiyamaella lignohabitans]
MNSLELTRYSLNASVSGPSLDTSSGRIVSTCLRHSSSGNDANNSPVRFAVGHEVHMATSEGKFGSIQTGVQAVDSSQPGINSRADSLRQIPISDYISCGMHEKTREPSPTSTSLRSLWFSGPQPVSSSESSRPFNPIGFGSNIYPRDESLSPCQNNHTLFSLGSVIDSLGLVSGPLVRLEHRIEPIDTSSICADSERQTRLVKVSNLPINPTDQNTVSFSLSPQSVLESCIAAGGTVPGSTFIEGSTVVALYYDLRDSVRLVDKLRERLAESNRSSHRVTGNWANIQVAFIPVHEFDIVYRASTFLEHLALHKKVAVHLVIKENMRYCGYTTESIGQILTKSIGDIRYIRKLPTTYAVVFVCEFFDIRARLNCINATREESSTLPFYCLSSYSSENNMVKSTEAVSGVSQNQEQQLQPNENICYPHHQLNKSGTIASKPPISIYSTNSPTSASKRSFASVASSGLNRNNEFVLRGSSDHSGIRPVPDLSGKTLKGKGNENPFGISQKHFGFQIVDQNSRNGDSTSWEDSQEQIISTTATDTTLPAPIASSSPVLAPKSVAPLLTTILSPLSSSQMNRMNADTTSGISGSIVTRAAVPSKSIIDLDRIEQGLDTRKTIMIRNIPNKIDQQMLKEYIDVTNRNTYDFLYLRIDFNNKCNVGYAFISFIDPRHIITFARARAGTRWNKFNSAKICDMSYAAIYVESPL